MALIAVAAIFICMLLLLLLRIALGPFFRVCCVVVRAARVRANCLLTLVKHLLLLLFLYFCFSFLDFAQPETITKKKCHKGCFFFIIFVSLFYLAWHTECDMLLLSSLYIAHTHTRICNVVFSANVCNTQ